MKPFKMIKIRGREQRYNGRDQGYNGRDQGYNGIGKDIMVETRI